MHQPKRNLITRNAPRRKISRFTTLSPFRRTRSKCQHMRRLCDHKRFLDWPQECASTPQDTERRPREFAAPAQSTSFAATLSLLGRKAPFSFMKFGMDLWVVNRGLRHESLISYYEIRSGSFTRIAELYVSLFSFHFKWRNDVSATKNKKTIYEPIWKNKKNLVPQYKEKYR